MSSEPASDLRGRSESSATPAQLGGVTHVSNHSHMTRTDPLLRPLTMHVNEPSNRRGPRLAAEDNVPHRFELFLLGEGEKKVTEEADTRIPNTSIFTFNKEDHTLGNMLSARLLQSPHVVFAGYKVPHPLFSSFILRVGTDGEVTPRAAVMQACKDLVTDLSILTREFTKEWELRKMVGDGGRADDKNGQAK